ncbi:MAG: hypothetical protein AAF310_01060 [Myxococcota bacterium]
MARCYKIVLVEEVQRLPELLDTLDSTSKKFSFRCGSFLFSSKISPELLEYDNQKKSNCITFINISGFQLAETWRRHSSKLCDRIAAGQPDKFQALKYNYTQQELMLSCVTGSFPEPALNRFDQAFCREWHTKRLQTYIEQEVMAIDTKLQPPIFKQTMRKLAQLSASSLPAQMLTRKIPKISHGTLASHLKILEGTGMWRNLAAYPDTSHDEEPETFGLMRDSGMLCHILKITSVSELEGHPDFPVIWRSFVWEELLKGFSDRLISIQPYHFTSQKGEPLLLLEGSFGKILVGVQTDPKPLDRHNILNTLNAETHNRAQYSYAIAITFGSRIRQVADKVFEIPVGCI